MNISKDIYEYLTFFVDCKTLLNMSLVNKYFSEDKFFIRVMHKKYPLLIKQKDINIKDIRRFYLKQLEYLYKLEKKDFPYIPSIYFYPINLFHKEGKELWNIGLKLASYTKKKYLIEYMVNKGADDFGQAIVSASIVGDYDLIIKLFNFNNNSIKEYHIEQALGVAAAGGYLDIIEFLISKGAKRFKNALEWGARNNRLDIVKFFQGKGVSDYERAKELADEWGHKEIFNYLNQF
jgi:hypothetical protein